MIMNIKSSEILKNLHDVLLVAKERYEKEYEMQEVKLSESFKYEFRNYQKGKGWDVQYFEHTTIVASGANQTIYIANQWFLIASYFVDFCTEMLTYRDYFIKICTVKGLKNGEERNKYSNMLRSHPSTEDKTEFINLAYDILANEFPSSETEYGTIAGYLWEFVTNYSWWAGSKTIERHDFFISPLLNQLNVVNSNAEYLALIVHAYASVLKLRILVDNVNSFTEGVIVYTISNTSVISPSKIESNTSLEGINKRDSSISISISAASLERFQSNI